MSGSHAKLVSKLHGRTAFTTYVTLSVVFFCMLAINIYAYFTIIDVGQWYASLENAYMKLRMNLVQADLTFRDIYDGNAKKEMQEVWTLLNESKTKAADITDYVQRTRIIEGIDKYKANMIKCYDERGNEDPELVNVNMDTYTNSQAELMALVNGAQDSLKVQLGQKMSTFNLLFLALIVNIVVLFGFTIFTFQSYITKSRRAEEQILTTEENLSTLINTLDSMLIAVDSSGTIHQWNRAAEKFFGVSEQEAMYQIIWDLLPYLKSYKDKVDTVLYSKKSKEFYKEQVDEIKGRYFNIAMHYMPGKNAVALKIDDVTEHERMDEQIRQSQKMEVVENLIGGLAHNFNNVLGAITGTISLMKYSFENKEQTSEEEIANSFEIIEASAQRATQMVRQLQSLTQRQEAQPVFAPVDLNDLVKNVLNICANTFDKKIQLVGEIESVKAMISADLSQIEQILLNLCDNSAQAMTTMRPGSQPQGGVLTMSVRILRPDKEFRDANPKAVESSYWVISVADTGVGMDEQVLSRIFDPFFTTKDGSKASGLGLTIANKIVEQHRGFIEVSSIPWGGTTFNVFLPELVVQAEAEEAAAAAPKKIPTGTGLILVVDDENIMRKTAKNILKKLGYEVIFGENGEEGVNVFRERQHEIAAVVLDMAMPKMNGKEAFIEMKKIQSSVKVLLASGFEPDEKSVQETLALGINGYIKKPYTMSTLAQEIKQIIG